MNWYNYIAIIALVVATGDLAWRIVEWRLKQARIKVVISGGFIFTPPSEAIDQITVKVCNFGKEPIKITSVALKCENNQKLIMHPGTNYCPGVYGTALPYTLKGYDSYEVLIEKQVMLKAPVEKPLVALCTDSLDKVYCSKKYKINV